MSMQEHKESAYAVRQFMLMAEKDCREGGEIKPARRLLTVEVGWKAIGKIWPWRDKQKVTR